MRRAPHEKNSRKTHTFPFHKNQIFKLFGSLIRLDVVVRDDGEPVQFGKVGPHSPRVGLRVFCQPVGLGFHLP